MTSSCLPEKDLLALLDADADADDARLAHVRTCPRCRSLIASYRLFAEAAQPDSPPRPGEEAAARNLARLLEDRIIGGAEAAGRGSTDRQTADRASSGRQSTIRQPTDRPRVGRGVRGWRSLFPALVPALGAAAVLIGAFLYVREETSSWRSHEPVFRGGGGSALPDTSSGTMTPLPARFGAGGDLELRWNRLRSADAYTLRFLDARFREIDRLTTTGDTSAVLTAERLRSLAGAGALYWQVRATRQGDPVAETVPYSLPAPHRDR